jgi:hypothetical protein
VLSSTYSVAMQTSGFAFEISCELPLSEVPEEFWARVLMAWSVLKVTRAEGEEGTSDHVTPGFRCSSSPRRNPYPERYQDIFREGESEALSFGRCSKDPDPRFQTC